MRNQAEHLLILLSNNRRYQANEANAASPVNILHNKTFENYKEWCASVGVKPSFWKAGLDSRAPPQMHAKVGFYAAAVFVFVFIFIFILTLNTTRLASLAQVIDLVLYFCIWGEAANLRHMPECIAFLYHKMHTAYVNTPPHLQANRSLYPGHFLDLVVSPIWNIISKNAKSKSDHQNKKNYDDLNEFFWSSKCLSYDYRAHSHNSATNMEEGGEDSNLVDNEAPLPSVR